MVFLFILFSSGNIFSQITYTSYYTQSFTSIFTTEIEDISRKNIFEPHTITIATNTKEGKEIQVLEIQEIERVNGQVLYLCTTRSNQKITIALPEEQTPVEIIDYYFKSPETNQEIQLRFHVEQIK